MYAAEMGYIGSTFNELRIRERGPVFFSDGRGKIGLNWPSKADGDPNVANNSSASCFEPCQNNQKFSSVSRLFYCFSLEEIFISF